MKYNGDDVQRTGSGDVTALFILTCQPSPLPLSEEVRETGSRRTNHDLLHTISSSPSCGDVPSSTSLSYQTHPLPPSSSKTGCEGPLGPTQIHTTPPRLSDASSWVTFSGGSSFSSPPVVGGTQHDLACFHFFPLFFFFNSFEYADGFGLHH